MLNMLLLGAPGAGKGTQAERLKKRLKLYHLSTGDILRDAVKKGTTLGKKAKEFMDRGELVPDQIILDMVKEVIEQKVKKDSSLQGFLYDGFPRTIHQAEGLDLMLADRKEQVDVAIYIEVDRDTVLKRISGRRTCSSCGALYNVYFKPPEKEGICDICGAELYTREDDNKKTVINRFDTYIKNTMPLIRYYEEKDKLMRVEGKSTPDEVFEQIIKTLDKRFNIK